MSWKIEKMTKLKAIRWLIRTIKIPLRGAKSILFQYQNNTATKNWSFQTLMKQILRLIGYDVPLEGSLKKANFLVSVLVEQITAVVPENLET